MMSNRRLELRIGGYQSGAILIVGLIMVLLITIVGLAAVRGSNIQELMAGNMRDMNVSFQGAESGLRIGESGVNAAAITSSFTGSGYWTDLQLPGAAKDPVQRWRDIDWQQNAIQITNIESIGRPFYVIERIVTPIGKIAGEDSSGIGVGSMDIVPEPEFFRVSSYSTGSTTTTETVVQSIFKTIN